MWGATRGDGFAKRVARISIHAPRVGSDFPKLYLGVELETISIHAPRVGSDDLFPKISLEMDEISIHAPRVGSDLSNHIIERTSGDFNPRSPCGERLRLIKTPVWLSHFNPRSPCGERPRSPMAPRLSTQFQSTLPVWGATLSRTTRAIWRFYFNPRSPCGERRDGRAS